MAADVTAFEHLGLLAAQIKRNVPELAVFLAPEARLLEVRRRGGPGAHIEWRHDSRAYVWASGPDAGAQLGATAIQAVEQVQQALL